MGNYQDAAVGKRIRLLSRMINEDSKWMPEESLLPGLEGTITGINLGGSRDYHQICVVWDNGRTLAILPYTDEYMVL